MKIQKKKYRTNPPCYLKDMVGSFIKFKNKLISYQIFDIINRKKKKKKEKKDVEKIIIPKSTLAKITPVITIKDIQECNRRQFGHLKNNGTVEIISYSNRSETNFFMKNSKNNLDSNRLSFQTSSIYVNEERPQQEKENFSKIEPNIFWQTINNLLRETEDIYNEICLNSQLEADPFDNFSIQLEDTIWEDDKNTTSSYSCYFNPAPHQEEKIKSTVGDKHIHNYNYECLNEIVDLYIQEEEEAGRNKKCVSVDLPSYQISSGSTLVLNK